MAEASNPVTARLREALNSRGENYRYVLVDRDDLRGYLDAASVDPVWSAQEIQRLRAAVEHQMAVSAERATEIERLTRESAHHLEARLNAGKAMSEAQDAAAVAEEQCDRLRSLVQRAHSIISIREAAHATFKGAAWLEQAQRELSGERSPPETTGSRTNDEAILRGLLAAAYSGSALYRDDGQLQDNSERPFIDYLHDSVREIERKITERGHCKLTASLAAAPMMRSGELEQLRRIDRAARRFVDFLDTAAPQHGVWTDHVPTDVLDALEPLEKALFDGRSAQEASAPPIREWQFDRYRNGRPMAEGVKVRAATEAEAREKAKSLSIGAGHWPSDELRLHTDPEAGVQR